MMDISVIMPTARQEYPIIGQPDVPLIAPTINSLSEQTFKDFEFIIVDALHGQRESYDFSKQTFPVKHIPVHPNHRFWLDRRRWNVCGALNTAIIHAKGDLIVRVDDCSEFDPDFLQRFWDGYQSGYFPLAMHTKYLGGKQAYYNRKYREEGCDFIREEPDRRKILEKLYKRGDPIRDTRWAVVEKAGGKMIAPINWYYGYSSASLEALLKINGYDELFDGDKSLEDADAGSRLTMAGYGGKFLLDVEHQVIEHEHMPIPDEVINIDKGNIKCNFAIYLVNQRKRRWRANSDKLTEEDLKFIVEESLRPPCSPRPNFYIDDCKSALFDLWANNQPIFNLREERLEI